MDRNKNTIAVGTPPNKYYETKASANHRKIEEIICKKSLGGCGFGFPPKKKSQVLCVQCGGYTPTKRKVKE